MIEYDFSIALERALAAGAPYRMEFPSSCVLFLRHTATTPDTLSIEVLLPDGQSFQYQATVVKAQLITSDELFKKRLLMLLPYYLMRYERQFSQIASDKALTDELVAECAGIQARFEALTLQENDRLLYEELSLLIIRVSDYLLRSHKALQKKVRAAMGGGEVLELMSERIERETREAREKALKEGRAEGLKQGREEGIEQGLREGRAKGRVEGRSEGRAAGRVEGRVEGRAETLRDLSKKLAALGIDQEVIGKVTASLEDSAATDAFTNEAQPSL